MVFANIKYSDDGIVWKDSSDSGTSFTGGGYGVAYNPADNRWVCVGNM